MELLPSSLPSRNLILAQRRRGLKYAPMHKENYVDIDNLKRFDVQEFTGS